MESINLLENLSVALMGKPFVLELLDLLVKSSLIVGLTLAVTRPFRSKLSNNSSHLLWLNCLLCIALLPVRSKMWTAMREKASEMQSRTLKPPNSGTAASVAQATLRNQSPSARSVALRQRWIDPETVAYSTR